MNWRTWNYHAFKGQETAVQDIKLLFLRTLYRWIAATKCFFFSSMLKFRCYYISVCHLYILCSCNICLLLITKKKTFFYKLIGSKYTCAEKYHEGPFIVLKGTVFYIAENSKNQIRIKDKNIIIIIIILLLLLLKNMKFPANQSLIRTSF